MSISVKDTDGVAISGAQVAVYDITDFTTALSNAATNGSGVVPTTSVPTGTDIVIRVRKSNTGDAPRYFAVETPANITANTPFSITMVEDSAATDND